MDKKRAYILQKLAERLALLRQADPLFLDTETTAQENGEVLDIAIVDLAGAVLLHTLVKPVGPISAGAQAVHHITPPMVAHLPAWDHHHAKVQQLLFGRTIIAYNAPFDEQAVARSCALHRLPAPMVARWQDLMRMYAAWWGEWNPIHDSYRWQKLALAVKQCGLTFTSEAHRALADADACRQLFLYLCEQTASGVLGAELRGQVGAELAVATAPASC